MPFRRKDYLFQAVKPLSVQTAVAVGDTEIEFDTTDYASSGAVFIGNDVILYTGKTSTEITGVTDISIYHNTTEKVYQLYALPSNISLPFNVFCIDQNGDRTYEVPYMDCRYGTNYSKYCSIITDEDGVNRLHLFGCQDERYQLIYYLNSVAMVNNNDVCVIPDVYANDMITSIAAGEILWANEETDDATPKLVD